MFSAITEIDRLTERPTNSYSVTAELSPDDAKTRADFAKYVNKMADGVAKAIMTAMEIPLKECSYTMTLTDSKGHWEKWLVVQRIGFERGEEFPYNVVDAFRGKELTLLPRGGVAALVASSSGIPNARHKRAFCFLPLPVKCELPVNINGHFALDHEARRDLWREEESGPKSEWNYMLLRRVITPAYITMLRHVPPHILQGTFTEEGDISRVSLTEKQILDMDNYADLFPVTDQLSDSYWRAMATAFYQRIERGRERLLPIVKESLQEDRKLSKRLLDERATQFVIEWVSTGGEGQPSPFFDDLDVTFKDIEEDKEEEQPRSGYRRYRCSCYTLVMW